MTWCYNSSISRLVCVTVYLKRVGLVALLLVKLQAVHQQSVFIQCVPNLRSARSCLHTSSIFVRLLIPSFAF